MPRLYAAAACTIELRRFPPTGCSCRISLVSLGPSMSTRSSSTCPATTSPALMTTPHHCARTLALGVALALGPHLAAAQDDPPAARALVTSWRTAQAWGAGSAALALGLLGCVYLLPAWFLRALMRHAHPSVLFCASTSARVCSLTIDDAPSASTPLILDVLRELKVRATFFVISGNIAGREHVLQRIVDEGHALANHLTEDRASILDDLHVFERKLQECDAAIRKFQPHKRAADGALCSPLSSLATPRTVDSEGESGDEPADSTQLLPPGEGTSSAAAASSAAGTTATKWMRPASGWFTTSMRKIIERHGYRICLGSVYPHDAQIRSEVVNSLHLRARTRCGSVIIVHDRSWTVGVLRTALPELVRKFSFVSLDELVEHHRLEHAREAT